VKYYRNGLCFGRVQQIQSFVLMIQLSVTFQDFFAYPTFVRSRHTAFILNVNSLQANVHAVLKCKECIKKMILIKCKAQMQYSQL